MEIELNDLLKMKEPLQRLINEKLPLKVAFRLNKLIKTVQENANIVEEERVKLVTRMGKKNKKTGEIKVPDEKVQEFQESFLELMQEKIIIDDFKFSIENFEKVELTAADMNTLDFMFEE